MVNERQIAPGAYAEIVSYIQLGLTELFSRFAIRTAETTIEHNSAITLYYLHSRYAESNDQSLEPIKYIKDSVENPFNDRVLAITTVFDSLGREVPLNNPYRIPGAHTPFFDCLQFDEVIDEALVDVTYRVDHPLLTVNELTDPTTIKVEIPPYLMIPLLYFVASRTYAALNVNDESQNSAVYLNKYEVALKQIQLDGLLHQTVVSTEDLFGRLGWI
jgi:hypothetical protein